MSSRSGEPHVLCVDDDPRTLRALSRDLTARGYRVTTAEGPDAALAAVRESPPDAAIVDLRLGRHDGIALLAELARQSPRTLRLLLTGFGDFRESVRATNEGHVFAFLEKPWRADDIDGTLRAGLEAHGDAQDRAFLREASTDTDVIDSDLGRLLAGFRAFELPHKAGHHERVETALRAFCQQLQLRPRSIECVALAARVHDLGEALALEFAGGVAADDLSPRGLKQWHQHPEIAARALGTTPALEPVAAIVRRHHECHDGSGFPDGLAGDRIPVPVRVFALADFHDEAVHGGLTNPPLSEAAARERIRRESGRRFDPRVVSVFLRWLDQNAEPAADTAPGDGVAVRDLRPGAVLAEDLVSTEGLLLVPAGHRLNEALIQRLHALGDEALRARRVRLRSAAASTPTDDTGANPPEEQPHDREH